MIKFKNTPLTKPTAVIYASNFEQVKELYEVDKEMAGELAISILEVALTGEISSDNSMVHLLLKNFEVSAKINQEKYEKKMQAKRWKEIEEKQLSEIAHMARKGISQQVIADTLGISRQTVNARLHNLIEVKYPELLEEPTLDS